MYKVSRRSFDSVDYDYKSQYDGYKGKFDQSFERGIASHCIHLKANNMKEL